MQLLFFHASIEEHQKGCAILHESFAAPVASESSSAALIFRDQAYEHWRCHHAEADI